MFERYRGVTIPYDELNDYALDESPFVNAKAMLKVLETQRLIQVMPTVHVAQARTRTV